MSEHTANPIPFRMPGTPRGAIALTEVVNIFCKADRAVRHVPPARTIGELRQREFGLDRVHFIVDGAGVDDDYELAPGCAVTALRLPEGPLIPIIITAVISAVIGIGISFLINWLFGPDQPSQGESGSATYGWQGMLNTRTQGSPIQVNYGRHRVAGQLLTAWRATDGPSSSLQHLYLIIGLGRGPLRDIGNYATEQNNLTGSSLPGGMRLNGIDAKTFKPGTLGGNGVTAWVRVGDQGQSAIGGDFADVIHPYPVDVLITDAWAEYTMHGVNDGAALNLEFPRGLWTSDGGFGPTSVEIQIERKLAGGAFVPIPQSPITFRGDGLEGEPDLKGTTTGFHRTVYDNGVGHVTEYRIKRTQAQHDSHEYGDVVKLQDVNEYTGQTMPPHAGVALVALKIDATEQLSGGRPLVTNMIRGIEVPAITAEPDTPTRPRLRYNYSRNPSWQGLHLLLDKEDGLGNWTSLDDIDVDSWIAFAAWCNETVEYQIRELEPLAVTRDTEAATAGSPYVVITGDTDLTFGEGDFVEIENEGENYILQRVDLGGERYRLQLFHAVRTAYPAGWKLEKIQLSAPISESRARCDRVFDQLTNAWDALQQILKTGRGIPIKRGRKLAVRIERDGAPVQLVSDANLIADSMRIDYVSGSGQVNRLQVQYLDEAKDYDQTVQPARRTSSRIDYQTTPKTVPVYGITRAAHARRRADYELKALNLIKARLSFEMNPDGLAFEPGDIFLVGSTLPAWSDTISRGYGTLASFTLDHDITLEAGETYSVLIRRPGDPAPAESNVTNGPGTYTAGTAITTDGGDAPIDGAPVVFGKNLRSTKAWRAVNITLTDDLTVKVEAAEYVTEVYDLAGWTFGAPPIPPGPCVLAGGPTYFIPYPQELQDCIDAVACTAECPIKEIDLTVNCSITGDGAGCVEIVDVGDAGISFRVVPGCEGDDFCIDCEIIAEVSCTNDPPGFCVIAGECEPINMSVCFTICP